MMSKAKGLLVAIVLSTLFFPPALVGRQAGARAAADVLGATQEILGEVSQLRGLTVLQPVKADVQSRADIERGLIKELDEETTPEEFDAQTKALTLLGLLPPEFKLREFIIELLTEQIAGYYRPETKRLYLADWLGLEEQRTVMVHELVHALQDQHFNLERFEDPPDGRGDRDLAIHALIEGEAMAVMINYILKPQKLDITSFPVPLAKVIEQMQSPDDERSQVLRRAPAAIRQTLLFPYTYGTGFIQAVLNEATWERISQAYQQLPDSTEQIMHPERFLLRDRPREIALPRLEPALGKGWKRRLFDVNGEFGYFVVLAEFIDEDAARQAADGWDGDQFVLYEQDGTGQLLLAHRSTWDTEADAREFVRAYANRTAKRYGEVRDLTRKGAAARLWSTSLGLVYLERRARDVVVLEGVPKTRRAQLAALTSRIWRK